MIYKFSGFKKIKKYKYKHESLVSDIHWSRLLMRLNKYQNFVIPKIKKIISFDDALKKTIEIINKKYINKSWISNETKSKVLKTVKFFYPILNKVLQLKKIDKILSRNNLFIVIPNLFLENVSDPYYYSDQTKCNELKLAYEFIIMIDQKPYEMILTIWIDAETGFFLGGGGYQMEFTDIPTSPELKLKLIYNEKNKFYI